MKIISFNSCKKDFVYFTLRVPEKSDKSVTQATRMRHMWHTSDASVIRVWHEFYTNHASVPRFLHEPHERNTSENFDFDIDTNENMFSHPYISYIQTAFQKSTTKFGFCNSKS